MPLRIFGEVQRNFFIAKEQLLKDTRLNNPEVLGIRVGDIALLSSVDSFSKGLHKHFKQKQKQVQKQQGVMCATRSVKASNKATCRHHT